LTRGGINMFWKVLALVAVVGFLYLEMTRIEIVSSPANNFFVERQTGGIEREKARYRVCRYKLKEVQCSLWADPAGYPIRQED
jgi:hypothetical protein